MELNKLTCPEFDNQITQYVIIKVICMVLFIPIRIISTHAATCDRVVLVSFVITNVGSKNVW